MISETLRRCKCIKKFKWDVLLTELLDDMISTFIRSGNADNKVFIFNKMHTEILG
jgi:hypothetical protein